MPSSFDILQELRIGWRIAIPIAIAQLLGAALLIAVGWPTSLSFMPEVPALAFRFWLGAAFATPLGFLIGITFQRSSGHRASPLFVQLCAAGAIVLPLAGIGLVGF